MALQKIIKETQYISEAHGLIVTAVSNERSGKFDGLVTSKFGTDPYNKEGEISKGFIGWFSNLKNSLINIWY